jgi:hypothetical protein
MDFNQAKTDIINWITGFVEQPHPALAGWPPCPFARRARLDGQLDIREGRIDPYSDLMKVTMENWMVIIYVYDAGMIEADRFEQQIAQVNQGFLVHRDIIALADHPNSPEDVLGVVMNQGTYAIAFVQSLNKLNMFARQIAAKGYYQSWSEDYLKGLFQFREDPRK